MAGDITDALKPENGGLTSDFLLDYAGRAEGYRLQVLCLEDFITKERTVNGDK